MRLLRVGLTGGIGSGKTTVAERFAMMGVPVIDADGISRALCERGQPALDEIVAVFGENILNADGSLDRASLRERVFFDEMARRTLESILHPRVRMEMNRLIDVYEAPYAVLAVPLLLESGMVDCVDRVLVVDCPEAAQIQRVMGRDGVTRAHVESILSVQCTRNARLAIADDVLLNDSDQESLFKEVDALHQRYLQWAMQTRSLNAE